MSENSYRVTVTARSKIPVRVLRFPDGVIVITETGAGVLQPNSLVRLPDYGEIAVTLSTGEETQG